ncbi:iron ABC transporter permease [Gordonia sinesedis]
MPSDLSAARIALAGTAVAVAALVLTPAVYLVIRAADATGGVADQVWRARTGELMWNTLRLAGAVTAASVLIGVGLAWCVSRWIGTGATRAVATALLTAPLAIPSYVSGFVWVRFFDGFEGYAAAVVVLTLSCYPLVMLPAIAALSGVGRSAEDAARTLGCGPVAAFLRVTVPRIRIAVAAGALLVALYTISDFGGPAIVRYEPFTVGIYNAYNGSFDRSVAAVYGCLLAAMALVITLGERMIRRDDLSAGAGGGGERPSAGRRGWLAWVCVGIAIIVGVVFPVVGLIRQIMESQRVSLSVDAVLPAASATLSLAAQAALVIVIVSLPVALYTARPRSRLGGAVSITVYLGYALPGVTVALSLVFAGIRLVPQWYQTVGLLLVAYTVLFLPVCVGPLRSSIETSPRGLRDAARTLGAGPLSTLVRVVLPAAAPGALAGAALVFVSVAKELPATLMLAPLGTRTLATDMWSLNSQLSYGQSAVMGLALIVVSTVPMVLLSSLFSRSRVTA